MHRFFKQSLTVIFILVLLLTGSSSGSARSTQSRILTTGWTPTGAMISSRKDHTLSVLPDGKALAAGGKNNSGLHLNTSEIYDPFSNTWTAVSDPQAANRSRHTATVLLDGRVLLVGGENAAGALSSAEIFNPATRQWDTTGSLGSSRYGHTATRLADGRVLVVGGCTIDALPSCTTSAELYNPVSGTWSAAAPLPSGARKDHTATLLADGSVLVAGGYNPIGTALNPSKTYNTAFRYNPSANSWSAAGVMSAAAPRGRSRHNAVLRRDGKVLVVGGWYYYDPLIGDPVSDFLDTSEIYDPAANAWSDPSKPISDPRAGMAAVLDANGTLILLGGDLNGSSSNVEYIDINSPADTWHLLFGELNVQRRGHAAAVLPGGVILIAGGENQDGQEVDSAETNRFTGGSPDASDPRPGNNGLYWPSATVMPNGDVLITGGGYQQGALIVCHNKVYRWVYFDDTFTDMPVEKNMLQPRCGHSTTLLPDGRVVVLGGWRSVGGSASGTGEIFNGDSWSSLNAGGETFENHKAVLLPNGKLFIFQGIGLDPYIFDPADRSFRKTLNLAAGSYGSFTTTLMKNGKVLILGSLTGDTVEVFDPATETFETIPHPSPATRFNGHRAVLLPDGRVMVAGGRNTNGQPRRETFFYNPDTGAWSPGPLLPSGRRYFSMLVLPDGRAVITGGLTEAGTATSEVLIYDPAQNAWGKAGDMWAARQEHLSVLTLKGVILNIGGLDQFSVPLSSVERFQFANISTSISFWHPVVNDVRCLNCTLNRQIEAAGSSFTTAWEGSSGITNQSAANQPLVQLYRLDNGQIQWLNPGQASSDTRFISTAVDFPDGPAIAFVYVNGGFQGKMVMLSGRLFSTYLPLLRK